MSWLLRTGMLLGVGLSLLCRPAAAQTRSSELAAVRSCAGSVCASRQPNYFIAHGSAAAVLVLGALVSGNTFPEPGPAVAAVAPPARAVANAALTLELTLPVPVLLTSFNGPESFDAAVTYGQVLFAAQLTDHVLRHVHLDSQATLAFSGAVISSYLFDQSKAVDLRVQGAFWGLQLGLATATAAFDVRGGRNDAGNAMAGAVLGVGLGVLAQGVHGGNVVPSPFAIFQQKNDAARYHDWRDHVWALDVAGIAAAWALSFAAPPALADPNLEFKVIPGRFGADGVGVTVQGTL